MADNCPVPGCDKPLPKNRKTCSLECSYKLKRAPDMACIRPKCGKKFKPIKAKSRYCCLECFNLHKIEAKQDLAPPTLPLGERAIPLTQGQWAIVDEDMYEELSKHNWVAVLVSKPGDTPIYYAKHGKTGEYMHAMILGVKRGSGAESLHGPGGTLYNVRKNLRTGTRSENQRDRGATGKTSRYKGVSWNFRAKKWAVHIAAGTSYEFIGYFDDEMVAAIEYDARARETHGKFARLNFPLAGEISALKTEVDRTCSQCEKDFPGPLTLEYCSYECLVDASPAFRSCLYCNRSVPGYSKFCTDKCKEDFILKEESTPRPPIPGAVYVPLTLGKHALIDEDDIGLILGDSNKWYAKEGNGTWYACRHAGASEYPDFGSQIRAHRLIMGLTRDDPRHVGHWDGNGLNLRRSNLYITSNAENHMNSAARAAHGMKGVTDLGNGYFLAKIYHNGQYEYIGRFTSLEEAAKAYDCKARLYHGHNGRFNFPQDGERSAK